MYWEEYRKKLEERKERLVYVLVEHHVAEGSNILGIFNTKISKEKQRELAKERTHFDDIEWSRHCSFALEEHEIE